MSRSDLIGDVFITCTECGKLGLHSETDSNPVSSTVLICSQTFPALTEGHGWLLEYVVARLDPTPPLYSAALPFSTNPPCLNRVIDNIFLAIYIFELLLKLYALRVTYFDSGWNNLDFVLVMTSVTEYVIGWTLQGILANTGDSAAALEIFRILRVFKTFRAVSRCMVVSFPFSSISRLRLTLPSLCEPCLPTPP